MSGRDGQAHVRRAGIATGPGAPVLASLLLLAGPSHAAGVGDRAEPDWPVPVHDDITYGQVFFDRFEVQAGDEEDVFLWDAQLWYGGDVNRLWIETEGEDVLSGGEGGELEKLDVQYSRRIARFWDVQAGVGYQATYGPGPDVDRASVLVSLQGLAPFWFEVDANLRVSEDSDVSASVEAEYHWLLSQRWELQARGESEYAFDAVEAFGIGEGVTGLTAGLRLRYYVAQEFAPYVGVTHSEALGDTADAVEAEGEDTGRTALVAGIRWWF